MAQGKSRESVKQIAGAITRQKAWESSIFMSSFYRVASHGQPSVIAERRLRSRAAGLMGPQVQAQLLPSL